jgi:Tfp pilus assembly protein PilV
MIGPTEGRAAAAPRDAGSGQAGFSAVKTIVAVVLFGILMLGLVGIFPLGLRTVEKGEGMTAASSLAQDEIERLKQLRAADPDLIAGAHTDGGNPPLGANPPSWVVTDDDPMAGMKRLDMTVTFSERDVMRTISMSTYLTP